MHQFLNCHLNTKVLTCRKSFKTQKEMRYFVNENICPTHKTIPEQENKFTWSRKIIQKNNTEYEYLLYHVYSFFITDNSFF